MSPWTDRDNRKKKTVKITVFFLFFRPFEPVFQRPRTQQQRGGNAAQKVAVIRMSSFFSLT